MADTLPISVVIIAKNEAARINDCLASVAWAAERVVVDDGSSDETVALAQRMGARVLSRRMDIEGRHRNWAYEQATQPWVLSLDADERVTPELAEEIRRLFAGTPPYDAYTMPRRNFIGTYWLRYGGWYPSAQLRLFQRGVFRYEEAEVHPRAICDRAWGNLRGDLVHYSYADISDFMAKLNNQTTREAAKWHRTGRRMGLGVVLWRAADRFVRAYVFKQGYRDGFLGLMAALFGSWYQLLSYAKYWELQQRGKTPP